MFSRLSQFATVALSLLVGGHAYAAPVIYGNYYDETVAIQCTNVVECRANFSQLPADKLLLVNQVSCGINGEKPVALVTLKVSTTFGASPLQRSYALSFPRSVSIDTIYLTSLQQTMHYLIGQARFPYVSVVTNTLGTNNVSCTIVGDLVTPLQ